MTQDEALSFLREHQPMPKDEDLTKDLLKQYDQARKYFLQYPNIAAIPLFLNSFGHIDGHGVYQLVKDVILKCPREEVIPYLKASLASEHYSVRYWSVQIAVHYPSEELLPLLVQLLEEDDFNLKYNTLTALGQFKPALSTPIVNKYLERETDKELRKVATDILST